MNLVMQIVQVSWRTLSCLSCLTATLSAYRKTKDLTTRNPLVHAVCVNDMGIGVPANLSKLPCIKIDL